LETSRVSDTDHAFSGLPCSDSERAKSLRTREELEFIYLLCYITKMAWEVEATDQFRSWYGTLGASAVGAIERSVLLLQLAGPILGRPHVASVRGSRHRNLKELRVRSAGKPIRVFFAFDPRRVAILRTGGDKKGDNLFYARMVAVADALYDEHLIEIETEINDG